MACPLSPFGMCTHNISRFLSRGQRGCKVGPGRKKTALREWECRLVGVLFSQAVSQKTLQCVGGVSLYNMPFPQPMQNDTYIVLTS